MNSYILHKLRNCIISRYLTRFLVQLVKREVCWHNAGRLLYFIPIVFLLFDPNITKTSILGKPIQIDPIPHPWNPAMFTELPDIIVRFTRQYRFMIITGNPEIVVIKFRTQVILEITLATIYNRCMSIIGFTELAECFQKKLDLTLAEPLGSIIFCIHYR